MTEHCSGQARGVDNKKNIAHFRKLKGTFRPVEDVTTITTAAEAKHDGSGVLGPCSGLEHQHFHWLAADCV